MTKIVALLLVVLISLPVVAISVGQEEAKQEETKVLIEAGLLLGDQSISVTVLSVVKLSESIGFMASLVSLGLPDWTVVSYGAGGGWWGDGSFIGGGILLQEDSIGGFATIAAWNDEFYLSFVSFHKTFYKSYTRLYVEGSFNDGAIVQGRIEAINDSSYSTAISGDGGIFVRADKLSRCIWLGFGLEGAWRDCADETTLPHVECGIRPGVRVDIGRTLLDLLLFYVWSNDGSEAWGVEASFHLSLPQHILEGTRP